MCQCPTSGLPHFYDNNLTSIIAYLTGVNALPRAFLISTHYWNSPNAKHEFVSMPYLGPSSFLRYALGTRINTGLPGSFLQVIHRIF